MTLYDLGYHQSHEEFMAQHAPGNTVPGRVVAAHKERYIVAAASGEYEAEVTGNMRYTAAGREDFPAVGDWVSLMIYDAGNGIIHQILPRKSVIRRQAAGHAGEVQIIAVNVDYAFIVQAAVNDFSLNRVERYLTICHAGGVNPVIVLTKTDLLDEELIQEIVRRTEERLKKVPVIAASNETRRGYDLIGNYISAGKTCCLLGSSGAGKSTLLNNLSGKVHMRTGAISESTSKGRHITSHRELVVLGSGGMLIDNPGMREVGIADTSGGLEATFEGIGHFASQCRYANCTHTTESGCAVIEAVSAGEIDLSAYENYLKLEKEKSYFETTAADKKRKERMFGKIVRQYKQSYDKRRK